MFDKVLFSKTNLPLLNRSMDASMLRTKVIANNIANVNTPGYRRVEVSFEDELRSALDRTRLKGSRTDAGHLAIGKKDLSNVNPEAYHPSDPSLASGVNNVDIDTEMAELAENQIAYNFAIKFGQGFFKKINAAIMAKPIQQ